MEVEVLRLVMLEELYNVHRKASRCSNTLQYFVNGAFSCGHVLYTSNDKGSPLPYWRSMHLLYNMTKSAIAIGHLALPFPPLHRKRKSENPLNISCKRNTQAIHAYQHPVHSLHDDGLLAVAIATSLASSRFQGAFRRASGPHFQIDPTIHRQLHLCVLTPPWSCEFPHARHMNAPIIGMRAMIGYLDVLQV
jgi:hypothetical protein